MCSLVAVGGGEGGGGGGGRGDCLGTLLIPEVSNSCKELACLLTGGGTGADLSLLLPFLAVLLLSPLALSTLLKPLLP